MLSASQSRRSAVLGKGGILLGLLTGWACGAETAAPGDGSLADGGIGELDARTGDQGVLDGALLDIGGEDGGVPGPCSPEALVEPRASTNYYLAIEDPAAHNDRCDGLAPVDEGNGRCPFKDLEAVVTRGLLSNGRDVRVSLRKGTYLVRGFPGLSVNGLGASAAERTILSNYGGERAVLDVPAPGGVGCTGPDAPNDPSCVRQVLVMSGRYTVVQGLSIHNGLGYHVEIRGGEQQLLRCNEISETVPFAMRSDLVKVSSGSTHVEISHNRLSRFRSQAIDVTEGSDILIEANEIFDPVDGDGGATGTKLGARRVTIRDNWIHEVCPGKAGVVFSLGGTGTLDHGDDALAYELHVVANRVEHSPCKVAQLISCQDCRFTDNQVFDVGAGVLLSATGTGRSECVANTTGCLPSRGAVIRNNRFRDLNGGVGQENIFVVAEAGEHDGLTMGDNLYCANPNADDARFGFEGQWLDHGAWVSAVGSDQSSRSQARSAAECGH